MTELWKWTSTEIRKHLASGEVSPEEVIESFSSRIEEINPKLNAVRMPLRELALERLKDTPKDGELFGVPMSVKENIDLFETATTLGIEQFEKQFPKWSAPHVQELMENGAIPLARTNLPDFGMRWHTKSSLAGETKNPWFESLSPGGSSGGDSAAVATGMVPLALGNDFAGSLRVPARFCGVASFRPTPGRIARATSLLKKERPILSQLCSVQGPLSRSVHDLKMAFAHMCRRDSRDPFWSPGAYLRKSVKRVGVPKGLNQLVDSDATIRAIQAAARVFESRGFEVIEVETPSLEETRSYWEEAINAEVQVAHMEDLVKLAGPEALEFLSLSLKIAKKQPSLEGYERALANRAKVARDWSLVLDQCHFILFPISRSEPFASGDDLRSETLERIMHSMEPVLPGNYAGLPCVSVPIGPFDGEFPQVIQIMGERLNDEATLEVAGILEEEWGAPPAIDPRW